MVHSWPGPSNQAWEPGGCRAPASSRAVSSRCEDLAEPAGAISSPRHDLRDYVEALRRRGEHPTTPRRWRRLEELHQAAREQPQFMGMLPMESLDALAIEFKPDGADSADPDAALRADVVL